MHVEGWAQTHVFILSSGLPRAVPQTGQWEFVCWVLQLSLKWAQIISLVLCCEAYSIIIIVDYCLWSWAYGPKRVLNDFVFYFIVIHWIHTIRQHKALNSLHQSLVCSIKTIQSSAYFSCPLEMNYCCFCFTQKLGNRFLHKYYILLASKGLKLQLNEI